MNSTRDNAGRQVKRLSFHLPETFDPLEFLPSRMMMDADSARYFMSLILTKLAHSRVDNNGFVRLHAKYLRNIMGRRNQATIVNSLLEGGAVRRSPYSVLDSKSFGYMLGDRYLTDKAVTVPITNPLLIERLRSLHEELDREQAASLEPIHHHLADQQRRLRIDRDQAAEVLATIPPESNPFDIQGILIDDIVNHRWRLSVSEYGRVFNCITGLKRELRKTLRVRGDRLVGVDIACAQPALMAWLMRETFPPCRLKGVPSYNALPQESSSHHPPPPPRPDSLPADFEQFTHAVSNGKLYEFLLWLLAKRNIDMTREQLKRRFLCDVIAKRGNYPSAVENLVREVFPTVYWFVRRVNHGGHEKLIRQLQKAERAVVIHAVCQRFADKYPKTFIITLHDSIYTVPSCVDAVTSTFGEVFNELDFPMKLKIDD